MHAVYIRVSVEPGHEEEALSHLHTHVVPRVKETPGIVAGYWLKPQDEQGVAVTLWESEDAAHAAVEMTRNAPRPDSVTFDTLEVREVTAHI
jgi:heme-degrading monooxygenase HmoA